MKQIDCSIVIVNWKSIDFLMKCIESIKKNTLSSYEIIVIDNNSSEDEQKLIKNFSDIKFILNGENLGFAAANNQGFRIAQGKYIFMLNPDTIILNCAIDKMMNFLEQNDSIYAVGPKLYYSEKLDYHPSVKTHPSPFRQLLWMLPLSGFVQGILTKYFFNNEKTQKVFCVWGAAILFKKEVVERIGYLDERFFVYTEEVDFCKRMNLEGLDLYYFPKAEIIHFGGKSQQNATTKKNTLLWASNIKYFEKYFSRKNILINFLLLIIILKIKITLFKKNELSPIIKVLNEYIKCAKKY